MPGVLKSFMTKLKRRRRWRSSKREMQEAPTEQLAQLSLSSTTSDQIRGSQMPPTPHVFGEKVLKFAFDPTPFTSDLASTWPGPSYDASALFAPGVFDKPRHLKRVPKRKTSKRTLSHDERFTGSPKPAARAQQKQMTSPSKKKHSLTHRISPPSFFGKPPRRDLPLHLLNLPGEIRNHVYRLLYVLDHPLIAHFRVFMRPKKGRNTAFHRFPREPALALVCKQLHHEVLSTFYAQNIFVFRKQLFLRCGLPQPPIMTHAASIDMWKPNFDFADCLTRLQVEFKTWNDQLGLILVYTLKRLRRDDKDKYVISSNLEEFDDWCTCTERRVSDRAAALLDRPDKGDSLLTLLRKFTALRTAEYRAMVNPASRHVHWQSDYTPDKASCEDCGQDHLPEMATGL